MPGPSVQPSAGGGGAGRAAQRAPGRDDQLPRPRLQRLGRRRIGEHRLQVGDRGRPVARLEVHQRPLLQRQRPERRAGRGQRVERRLPLRGVHRRAEQHHPLQRRERRGRAPAPRRRRPARRAPPPRRRGRRPPRGCRPRASRATPPPPASPRRTPRAPRPASPRRPRPEPAAAHRRPPRPAPAARALCHSLAAAPPTISTIAAAISQPQRRSRHRAGRGGPPRSPR